MGRLGAKRPPLQISIIALDDLIVLSHATLCRPKKKPSEITVTSLMLSAYRSSDHLLSESVSEGKGD